MKRLFFAIVALAFFAISCENNNSKSTENTKSQKVIVDEITAVSMSDFDSLVESLAGRKISISGTVDHVCKHGGQKLFIVDQNTDTRIKITPNEEIAAFNTDLIGETIKITGIVEETRVDEDYLKEWEEEVLQGAKEKKEILKGNGKHESADAGDHNEESENSGIQEDLDQIAKMRTKVEQSEKGYLSFYSILAVEYQVFKLN